MRAWILRDIGKIEYTCDEPVPDFEKDEVLVRVKAAGICGSDIPRVYETGAHRMPLIIGHEFSGIVERIGSNVDEKWDKKRVGIFPLIPCRKCPSCVKKQYEMCRQYNYLGSRTNGGFEDYVAVPAKNLIELPEEVGYEQAAMLEPMSVAVHAIRRCDLNKDMTVVVSGMGTIGQFVVMFLREHGIKNVFALGNKLIQKKVALSMGLDENNYYDIKNGKAEEWILSETSGRGADVYFECVGKNESVTTGIECIIPGGQICLIGNPATDICLEKNTYQQILRKQLILRGAWNSSFLGDSDLQSGNDDWNYVVRCLKERKISPQKVITHRYELSQMEEGLKLMRDKTEEYVKVMMILE